MKVRSSIKKRSKTGFTVKRGNTIYFIDKLNPKLKQRQGRNTSRGKKKKKK